MSNQKLDVEVRRQMLQQMCENLLKQGFEAETNAQALAVQIVPEEQKDTLEKAVSDYKTKSENCYRSAETLSAELAKLPKPKKAQS